MCAILWYVSLVACVAYLLVLKTTLLKLFPTLTARGCWVKRRAETLTLWSCISWHAGVVVGGLLALQTTEKEQFICSVCLHHTQNKPRVWNVTWSTTHVSATTARHYMSCALLLLSPNILLKQGSSSPWSKVVIFVCVCATFRTRYSLGSFECFSSRQFLPLFCFLIKQLLASSSRDLSSESRLRPGLLKRLVYIRAASSPLFLTGKSPDKHVYLCVWSLSCFHHEPQTVMFQQVKTHLCSLISLKPAHQRTEHSPLHSNPSAGSGNRFAVFPTLNIMCMLHTVTPCAVWTQHLERCWWLPAELWFIISLSVTVAVPPLQKQAVVSDRL